MKRGLIMNLFIEMFLSRFYNFTLTLTWVSCCRYHQIIIIIIIIYHHQMISLCHCLDDDLELLLLISSLDNQSASLS